MALPPHTAAAAPHHGVRLRPPLHPSSGANLPFGPPRGGGGGAAAKHPAGGYDHARGFGGQLLHGAAHFGTAAAHVAHAAAQGGVTVAFAAAHAGGAVAHAAAHAAAHAGGAVAHAAYSVAGFFGSAHPPHHLPLLQAHAQQQEQHMPEKLTGAAASYSTGHAEDEELA
jgi:hypothetical protein